MSKCACHHNEVTVSPNINRAYRHDPTKTLTLRNRFVMDMRRRFKKIATTIWQSVAVNDCFGLEGARKGPVILQAAEPGEFAFEYDADKIESFIEWLRELVEEHLIIEGSKGILIDFPELAHMRKVTKATAMELWANAYLRTAYQQSIAQARARLRAAGFSIPQFEGLQPGMSSMALAFNQPVHLDRVSTIFLRTYNDLKGITDDMSMQISRILAQGMAEGRNPRVLARMMVAAIEGGEGTLEIRDTIGRKIPAMRRAEILARTEVIRAHHMANITEYENAGVEDVFIMVEWLTAGDSRVCPICKDYAYLEDGKTPRQYSIEEIKPLIPKHPQCRCVAIPSVKSLLKLKKGKVEELAM